MKKRQLAYNYAQTSCTGCLKPLMGRFFSPSKRGGNIFLLHIKSSLQWSSHIFHCITPPPSTAKASGLLTSDCVVPFICFPVAVSATGCANPWLSTFSSFSQMDAKRNFCYVTFTRMFIWAPVTCMGEGEECILLFPPHLTCSPTATASPWLPLPL